MDRKRRLVTKERGGSGLGRHQEEVLSWRPRGEALQDEKSHEKCQMPQRDSIALSVALE